MKKIIVAPLNWGLGHASRCVPIIKELQKNQIKYTSNFMRIWNEGATLILFAVVFLVLLKSTLNMAYGMLGLVGLAILLMLGIKLYKRTRSE